MKVLDLFCGVGGATRGYQFAGHNVTGIDLADQPEYCGDAFTQHDALAVPISWMQEFDFIHASPPCPAYSTLTKGTNQRYGESPHPKLIPYVRSMLNVVGVPYVIENTRSAPIRPDLTLCGEMFGLEVIRHRDFEFGNGAKFVVPKHKKHRGKVMGMRHGTLVHGPYYPVHGHGYGNVRDWQRAMGIDWTYTKASIADAIPPAYTRYIGENL